MRLSIYFGDTLNKVPILMHLLQSTAPYQFAVMHGDIGTAVTHVLSAVRFEIYRLNDHKALDIGGAKKIARIGNGAAQYFGKNAAHVLVDQAGKK